MNGSPTELTSLFPAEIAEYLGLKPFQGRQIFQWIHRRGVFDFDAMTNLSMSLRQSLGERCVVSKLRPAHLDVSPSTGTRKALFSLDGGDSVEAVLIPAGDRVTFCLSSQVGCAVKCSFCATGIDGFQQNLTAGEIVEQAIHLVSGVDMHGRTPNIVYMGMGEPMRNYDAVARSIRLLMCEDGLHIGARKITVSTAGEIPGIKRFAKEDWQVRLSISLHAANDALRSELVPLNRKYPLEKLMDAVRDYMAQTGRHVTFEWTLIDEVNDRPEHARELVELIGGLNTTVNLIPYNPVDEFEYRPVTNRNAKAFKAILEQAGVNATLRLERGQDINAACGQLRLKRLQNTS